MATAVEASAKTDGVFAAIIPEIKALHGYTHGGLEQLARRFDREGNLHATYSAEEKIEVIRVSTALVTLFAITWSQMIEGARPTEPRSAVITERYMQLFPHQIEEVAAKKKPSLWQRA